MKDTQKSVKSTAATDKKFEGFTDEERGAMKERAQELSGRAPQPAREKGGRGKRCAREDRRCRPDRAMAERLHAVIKASAPALSPRLWYGMPAYAKDGKVVCFFQSAQKFHTRYATFGFNERRTSTKAPCGRPPSL